MIFVLCLVAGTVIGYLIGRCGQNIHHRARVNTLLTANNSEVARRREAENTAKYWKDGYEALDARSKSSSEPASKAEPGKPAGKAVRAVRKRPQA